MITLIDSRLLVTISENSVLERCEKDYIKILIRLNGTHTTRESL